MINVFDLKPGDRLKLRGNVVAEVVENMEDGMWVQVRVLETPEGEPPQETELCHAQDIVTLLPAG